MVNWKNRKVLVVGLGSTGISLLKFFIHQNTDVSAYDIHAPSESIEDLCQQHHIPLFSGSLENVLSINQFDILALSPGISTRLPEIQQFCAQGGQIIGDIDILATLLQNQSDKIIAITGSNGKTTVTSLVGFLCRQSGLDTVVAGNIGTPVLDAYLARQGKPADVWVLELSSFQLETVTYLIADAATVLNISEDHIERYADLLDYAYTKSHIFNHCRVQVLNADDKLCCAMRRNHLTTKWFSLTHPVDYWYRESALYSDGHLLCHRSNITLQGDHNIANVLAALALCESIGLSSTQLVSHLASFSGLPHRVEKVAEYQGITYIDDSKGTNVGATCAALQGLDAPIVLIAGGLGKGQDFSPLQPALANKARAVLLIGQDAPNIAAVLKNEPYPVIHCHDMYDAVLQAAHYACEGDIVLLSPACASFDMFDGYAHRSAVFVEAINHLKSQSSL